MDDVTFGRSGPDGMVAARCSDCSARRGDTGAESDVCECLVSDMVHVHCCPSSTFQISTAFSL